jgi:hypothetical protein
MRWLAYPLVVKVERLLVIGSALVVVVALASGASAS